MCGPGRARDEYWGVDGLGIGKQNSLRILLNCEKELRQNKKRGAAEKVVKEGSKIR